MKLLRTGIVALLAAGGIAGCVKPMEDYCATLKQKSAGPVALRGFGTVSVTSTQYKTPQGEISLAKFTAESPEKAVIVGSKYLADLQNYGAVRLSPFPDVTLEVRHGGVWRLALDGCHVYAAHAPNVEALRGVIAQWGLDRMQPVPEHAYPRFLDNFDNAALAIWWMGTITKTPEQLQWMREIPAIATLHYQMLTMPAYGVSEGSSAKNAVAQLSPMGKPYRTMLWSGDSKNSFFHWMTLPGEHVMRKADGVSGHNTFNAGGYYQQQMASDLVHAFQLTALDAWQRQWNQDPNLISLMEPHGEVTELGGRPNAVPPGSKENFIRFLKEKKGYSLNALSLRWTGKSGSYESWSTTPYPDDAWFYGRRNGEAFDLDAIDWKWRQAELADGEKREFFRIDFNDADWVAAPRSSQRLMPLNHRNPLSLWSRFSIEIPDSFLRGKKEVWLHLMPYTRVQELNIWINGGAVARKLVDKEHWVGNEHSEVEIGKFLKPGRNYFTIHSAGGAFTGRVFLNGAAAEPYPYADRGLNALLMDWNEFRRNEKFRTVEMFARALRSGNPNLPIDVMTPNMWLSDFFDASEKLGLQPRLTGEGAWYRPMHYKGYAQLRNRLGVSEPSGAAATPENMQYKFSMLFQESQDNFNYVFDLVRELFRYPEVRRYWEERKAFLRTFGKTNLPRTDVGLLRDTGQDWRFGPGGSEIWNWDLARGPLPELGFIPVLVDGDDLVKGLADTKVKLLLDCATVVMDSARVAAVKRFVEQGGTFVTQHHTGQHAEFEQSSWPLAKALGLAVEERDPKGMIAFTPDEKLFPSLRGKTISAYGCSIRHDGRTTSGAIAITGPGLKTVASWSDGKAAIAELPLGKGKIVFMGSPFLFEIADITGKFLNTPERQQRLGELLDSLGFPRESFSSNPVVWADRRISKNGLYDVYFSNAAGDRNPKWKLSDQVKTELAFARPSPVRLVEATAEGTPDRPTHWRDGKLELGELEFSPYQVRQFAAVRENVGLESPVHWLLEQERGWYALPPAESPEMKEAHKLVDAFARKMGERGLDVSENWQVEINPKEQDLKWLTTDCSTWRNGNMGSWIVNGWPEAETVRYRKRIALPADWRDGKTRLFLGIASAPVGGVFDTATVYANGREIGKDKGTFMLELPRETMNQPDLELAMEVRCAPVPGKNLGPCGTLFLRAMPTPEMVIDLAGPWEVYKNTLEPSGRELQLPGKGKAVALSRRIAIPADWAGKVIRLSFQGSNINGFYINHDGFIVENNQPIGVRLDRYLRPGEVNTITLSAPPFGLDRKAESNLQFDWIRLEAYTVK